MAAIKPIETGKRLFREVGDDDAGGLAAELAYHFLLALFPFFIFLTALGGVIASLINVNNPAQSVVNLLGANLPPETAGLLTSQLQSVITAHNPGLLSFGIIGALWAATSGMKSVMKAMNRAFDVPESRSFLKKHLVALGLTLLFSLFVFLAFALLVIGEFFAREAAAVLGLPALAVDLIRWALAIMLIAAGTAVLYWAAPNLDLEFRWVSPGSVLFTIGWLAATALFAFYVRNFGSYNATYGALGGMVVLLIWFFLTGYILILGAELNAIIDQQVDPEKVEQRRRAKHAEAARGGQGQRGAEQDEGAAARPVPSSNHQGRAAERGARSNRW